MRAQMHILRDIIYGISARGADLKEVCDQLDIAPAQLKDAEQWASYKAAAEVWNVAIDHTDDPLIGLHLGEELTPAILGIIGYLMQSATNLQEAFSMISKYNALYSTMMKFYQRETKDVISLHYSPALRWQLEYKESARQSVEMGMSGVLKIFRMLSGKTIVPVQVELAFSRRRTNEYARIFKSPVKFNATENKLIFRKQDLLQEVISHDKSLFAFFNSTLEQRLKNLDESERFSDKLKQLIIREFKGHPPSIQVVASQLNLTPRSLQRRLKEEHTTYRTVSQSIKKDLANVMMKNSNFRVSEVAETLGYSDLSSFGKAYKRWRVV